MLNNNFVSKFYFGFILLFWCLHEYHEQLVSLFKLGSMREDNLECIMLVYFRDTFKNCLKKCIIK